MSESHEGNGWSVHQKLVMDKLEGLEQGQKELTEAVASIKTDIAVQKAKAGMWGAIAGAIPAIVIFIWDHFTFQKR